MKLKDKLCEKCDEIYTEEMEKDKKIARYVFGFVAVLIAIAIIYKSIFI